MSFYGWRRTSDQQPQQSTLVPCQHPSHEIQITRWTWQSQGCRPPSTQWQRDVARRRVVTPWKSYFMEILL